MLKTEKTQAEVTATRKENTIAFAELENYNDSNSFVWLAMLLPTTEAEIKATCEEITEWLLEKGFISKGSVIDLKNISGNIAGAGGRNDVLVILSKDCGGLAPLKRLQTDDMKWTSDFIINYASDYGNAVEDDEDYYEEDEI